MNRLVAICVACLATVGTATADTLPQPLPVDPRIGVYTYNENAVYRLDLHTRYISTILFAEGEIIESIQIGDSASWQIVRLERGDVMSVKPLIEGAATNMTVLTNRGRIYTFDLRARAGRSPSHDMNYRLTFSYPNTDIVQFAAVPGAIEAESAAYLVSGEASFRPVRIYDNGRQTTIILPDNAPTPGVFAVDDEGYESTVNARQSGNIITVDGIAAAWSLRIGDDVVCISADGGANG